MISLKFCFKKSLELQQEIYEYMTYVSQLEVMKFLQVSWELEWLHLYLANRLNRFYL